jgi:hypothetical protein
MTDRHLGGRAARRQEKHSHRNSKSQRHVVYRRRLIEGLERRLLLTTTLYIDYGDRFPAGTLTTTVGAIDNTTAVGNPNMDGPLLFDGGGNFPAATNVDIASVNLLYAPAAAAALRAEMTAYAQRMYQGTDITVVELTGAFQMVNGFNVRAAASTTEISQTLGLNEGVGENNDGYIIVGQFEIGAADFNPAFSLYGGLSTGTDIAANNNNDGTALVCLLGAGDSADFNGPQIVHEAGHTFGLRHVYRQNPGSPPPAPSNTTATGAQYDKIHQSEVMSYLGYANFGGHNVISRYPMMRGDGNTNANLLASTGSPFEQLMNDPNIGPNPNLNYVTGTGANDTIVITKTGANSAAVAVSAFDNATYTTPIDAPGATGNTYTFVITLDKPLIIDAGALDDRVTLDGDLGITITLRGMHGTDQLYVDGKGAGSALYSPGTNTAAGIDGNADRRGTVSIGTTTINFQEFETTSLVRIINVGGLVEVTPLAGDTATISNSGGEGAVAVTSGGVVMVPLRFTGVTNFTLDAAVNGSGATADNIGFTLGAVAGLTGVNINTGGGNDTISYSGTGVTAVVTVSGGAGNDTLAMTNVAGANPVFLAGGGTTNTATVNSGSWTANADLGAGGAIVTVNATSGDVTFGSTQHLAALTAGAARTVAMAVNGNRVLVTNSLTLNATAKLDLNDNDFILDYPAASQLVAIQNLIASARSGGTWLGNGITSTSAKNILPTKNTTLGAMEASEYAIVHGGAFDGETLTTAVYVKYTYYGDANFSGAVTFDDYVRIDIGFNTGLSGWVNGDFNYSGGVNFDDYVLIDTAFNTQSGTLGRRSQPGRARLFR